MPHKVISNNLGVPNKSHIIPGNGGCGGRDTTVYTQEYKITNTVFSMSYTNMPAYGDDGMAENPCYPEILIADPGFALTSEDPWYAKPANAHQQSNRALYKVAPPNDYLLLAAIGGWPKNGYTKRDADGELDPEEIFTDEGNSTRRPTEEELLKNFGLLRCKDGCEEEMEDLGIASLPCAQGSSTSPSTVDATTTALNTLPTTLSKVLITATEILEEVASLITPPPMN